MCPRDGDSGWCATTDPDTLLEEIAQIARIGRWELDLVNDRLWWSPFIYELFEVDPRVFPASYEGFLSFVHPEDRDAVNQAYRGAVESHHPHAVTHRLLMPDGRVKWVGELGRTDYSPDGSPIRSVGIVQEITETRNGPDAGQGPGTAAAGAPKVEITVSDTGHGMDAAVRERLFEPFFTTKESGQGTGLGLATVHGIVAQSGGTIGFTSAPQEGTSFRILLPRVAPPPEAAPSHSSVPGGDATPGSGSAELILLVEDEPAVRKLAQRVLEQAGYRVLTASNGVEALREHAESAARTSLLVTDVVMPGLNGRDLARRLIQLAPQIRVLFMSGYTEDVTFQEGMPVPGTRFLAKPFGASALLEKVREILDG